MSKTFLAFDLGASSGRAILGELKEGKLELTEVHRFANGAVERDGSLHWDFTSLSGEIKDGLKKAVATGRKIDGIAVDTWGVDYVLFSQDGQAIRDPYHYRDSRTDGVPEEVYKIVPEKELYSRTGIQFMQLNTIFQLCAHKKHHPQDFEGATIQLMPDALTYLLCGKFGCEYTEASTSELLDAKAKNWDYDLIEKLGLPKSMFPDVDKPCTLAGTLTQELQDELGCGPINVYRVGSHDTASAVGAVPAENGKNWAYVSCGTWALLGAEIDAPILTEEARAANFTNEGGLDGKIRFLTNITGTWLVQESRRVWNEQGKGVSFADIENMAVAAKPARFLVNPNDAKFMAPSDMPAAISEYCEEKGQGKIDEDAAVARCVYDSLALTFRVKIEKLQALLGHSYEFLNIVGGGTKDRFLMQLAASCLGIPVVAGPIEATAAGNLIAQAIASGEISSLAEAREVIKKSFEVETFQPQAEEKAMWDEAYERFIKL